MTAEEILKLAEFDENAAYDNAKARRNKRSEQVFLGKMKSVPVNREAVYAFVSGAEWQHARLKPLIEALAQSCEEMETLLQSINVQQIVNGKVGQELRATQISETLATIKARMEKLR